MKPPFIPSLRFAIKRNGTACRKHGEIRQASTGGTVFDRCLTFLMLLTPVIAYADVPFEHVVVDSFGPSDMHSKVAADINGDGFIDLVVAGAGGEIYWYEYPSWTRHVVTTSGGGWSTDIEAGDVDRDGDIDLIASDYYQNTRMVWLENPGAVAGNWTIHVIGAPSAHDIEVADLDGDGDLDIATRHQGSAGNEIVLWRQDSPASWTQRKISCPAGEGLHVGDLDGDGDPDVVIGSRWYENDGGIIGGTWNETVFATSWTDPEGLPWIGDINNDGRMDIVISPSEFAGSSYRISWFKGPLDPRTAGWEETVIDSPVETVLHSISLGDIDNDGDVDVATAEMEQGTNPDEVRVYFNLDGDGTNWSKQVIDSNGSHNIRLADIGGDGDLDIFGTNWTGDREVELWENLSGPAAGGPLSLDSWTYIEVDSSRTGQPFGLDFRDINGDGFAEIVSGKYFYRNPGNDMTGSWARTTFPVDVDGMLFADIDGDQFADVIAEKLPDVYWLEALDLSGTAWSATVVASLPATSHGDGQGYALAQVVVGGKNEILLSTGDGIHYIEVPGNPATDNWNTVQINSPGSEEGIGTGDIDGDGHVDVVGGITKGSARVGLWINPGDNSPLWQMVEIGSLPSEFADRFEVADLDNDGRLDVVVSAANGANNGVYWFKRPANPFDTNWPRSLIALTGSANSMDASDFDGDGDIDVVVGEHQDSLRTIVFENTEDAVSWVPHQIDSGRESHLGARSYDIDNDGDLDVLSIAWSASEFLHLWRNNAMSPGSSGGNQDPIPQPPSDLSIQ